MLQAIESSPPAPTYVLEDACLTYPHCNGFLPDGDVIVGQNLEGRVRLVRIEGDGGAVVGEVAIVESGRHLYFDVSLDGRRLAYVANGAAYLIELAGAKSTPRQLWRATPGTRLVDICSLNPDGSKLLLNEWHKTDDTVDRSVVHEIDLSAGTARIVVDKPWTINHVHYAPADPTWIGFCKEGKSDEPARPWAWHDREAPDGRALADQSRVAAGKRCHFGHERWAFHDTSLVCVSYDKSGSERCGVWAVDTAGAARRLVAGINDWHCDISRDGRLIAIDTFVDGDTRTENVNLP